MSPEYTPDIQEVKHAKLHILRPENPISPFPIHVAIGFGNEAKNYRVATTELYNQGFIATCADYQFGESDEPRFLGIVPDAGKLKLESIDDVVKRVGYRNEQGNPQINILAHSLGFPNAIEYAIKNPQSIRTIVGVAPGGIRGKNLLSNVNFITPVKKLKLRSQLDDRDKFLRMQVDRNLVSLISENEDYKIAYEKQGLRYKWEGFFSALKSVQRHLPKLIDQNVNIALILNEDDSMFPMEETLKALRPSMFTDLRTIPGIHGEVKYNPRVARLAAELIKRYENIS